MLEKSEDFIAAFNVDGARYKEVTQLIDAKFGFSVKRNYPRNNRYVQEIKKIDPGADEIAAIWIVLLTENVRPDGKIPLKIRIADFTTMMGATSITPDEVHFSDKKIARPMQVESIDDYFFDPKQNAFINNRNIVREPNVILDRIFELHCNSVYPIKLPLFFAKRWLKRNSARLCSILIKTFDFIVEKGFGAKLEHTTRFAYELSAKQIAPAQTNKNQEAISQQTIMGWKSEKAAIILFCFIVCLSYLLKRAFGWQFPYIHHIMANSFLVLVHVLFIFAIFEMTPKILLLPGRNLLAKIRWWLLFSPTKMMHNLN